MPGTPEQLLALARRFANRALLAHQRAKAHASGQRPEAAAAWMAQCVRSRTAVRRLIRRIEEMWLPPL